MKKELRIGNYVSWKGEFVEICEIGYDSIRIAECPMGINFKEITPIELNDEILLKITHEKSKFLNERMLRIQNSGEVAVINLHDLNIYVGCCMIEMNRIRHLHQLQNLYFSLTGKELEINLNF